MGEKVVLRAPEVEDADTLVRWVNDPELARYRMPHFPYSRAQEREWIERASRSESDRVLIIQTHEGRPIGVMGLHRIDQVHRQAELGIFIGEKEYWGHGYGTDAIRTLLRFAFNQMNFHRIYLRVDADNVRAQRCYEKCGFVREGTLRQAVFRDGGWVDQHLMAVLADEFRRCSAPDPLEAGRCSTSRAHTLVSRPSSSAKDLASASKSAQ